MAVAIRRDLIPDYDLSCCLLPMTSWHFLVKGLGIGAAVLTSFSCVPQVRKALPQRSTADLSLKTLIALTAGLIEEKEKRGFIKLNLISLAFTLAGIGVLHGTPPTAERQGPNFAGSAGRVLPKESVRKVAPAGFAYPHSWTGITPGCPFQ